MIHTSGLFHMIEETPREAEHLPVDKLGRKSGFFKDSSNKKRA
jgi:hypothetical protein